MIPYSKQAVISSLGLCTASWLMSLPGTAAANVPAGSADDPTPIEAQVRAEAMSRYYHPFVSIEGIRPLDQPKRRLTYEIESGDTLSEIAKKFDLSTEKLAAFNHIDDIDRIHAGNRLDIPYTLTEIRLADNQDSASLAKKYRISEALIHELNPKLKEAEGDAAIGQVVTIPTPVTVPMPKKKKLKQEKTVQLAARSSSDTPKQAQAAFSGNFAWPVGGHITSPYGTRNGRIHQGIDIWHEQEGQAAIKAAAAGTVKSVGYSGGYGNLVVIDHGSGWSTYYGHLRVFQVESGQRVTAGDPVGYMGSTGNSTGYHLHFEVRKDGEALDPMHVLP